MNDLEDSVSVVLGKLLAKTDEIKDIISRVINRQDNIEVRVEILEKAEAIRAHSLASKVVDRAIWAILAAAGVLILKQLGFV